MQAQLLVWVEQRPHPPTPQRGFLQDALGEGSSAYIREFKGAVLPVKWEVGDGDGAGGAEDGRWQPVDIAGRVEEHVARVGNLEGSVVAGGQTVKHLSEWRLPARVQELARKEGGSRLWGDAQDIWEGRQKDEG